MPDIGDAGGERGQRDPVTLIDLLQALERSADLRSLARDCGLSVRELRRRLRIWSQEASQEAQQEAQQGAQQEQETEARERPRPAGEGELFPGGERPAPEAGAPRADSTPSQPRPEQVARPRPGRAEWPELTAAGTLDASPLPAEGEQVLEAWTDGASRGNPGPAAIGIVFRQKDGPALAAHAEAIGRATNNEAEYRAVICALELCQRWRVERLDLFVDSELVARQLRGLYRVKSPSLRPLYQQAAHLARGLRQFRVRHVPRERNRHADHLASSVLGGG